jgi:ubiquinone/menaquinone biosynthesis C-methylase UbiE
MNQYFNDELMDFETITLARLTASFDGDLLDLGCSTGILTKHLHTVLPSARSITGVDVSKRSISIAQKFNNEPRCKYIAGDMHGLLLGTKKFDFIYSRYTVHYSTQIKSVMDEIYRLLTPAGKAYIKVCHPIYELFTKQSHNYANQEAAEFIVQIADVSVKHPTHTVGEYVNSVLASKLAIDEIEERFSILSNFNAFNVPTQLIFHVHKPA